MLTPGQNEQPVGRQGDEEDFDAGRVTGSSRLRSDLGRDRTMFSCGLMLSFLGQIK
jgi:hypothetical protein